jgi:general nucleoside transport system permease protein
VVEQQATAVLVATVTLATPLLLAALGALLSDRSGVFAIGMEGYMLIGAFTAVAGSHFGGQWLGLAGGMTGGLAAAAVYALLAIALRVDQVIAGIAIDILALGATTYFNGLLVAGGEAGTYVQKVEGLNRIAVPGLAGLPVLGASFFDQNLLVYVAVVLVVVVRLVLSNTYAGLSLRATGENPLASEVRGISVIRTRWIAVLLSGTLGGLAGTALSLGVVHTFVDNMTAGRGFIALAAVFFAGWRPLVVLGACALFGAGDAAQLYVNSLGLQWAPQLVAMFPYVITLVVLAGFVGRRPHPAALGHPFSRERR